MSVQNAQWRDSQKIRSRRRIWQHQGKLVSVHHILRNAKIAILETSDPFHQMSREGIARIVDTLLVQNTDICETSHWCRRSTT